MKPLNERDMVVANEFLKRKTRTDKKFWLDCWRLMLNKHQIGGDMDAVQFFI